MTLLDVDVAMDAEGLISITPSRFPSDSWLGLHTMPVTGGVLQVDAKNPAAGVRAFLAAPEVADWLVPLFGVDVTREVMRLSLVVDPAEHSTPIPVDTGQFYERTVRLVYGLWLRRWWPSPDGSTKRLDEWLLDVELGDLAAAVEQLFDGARPAVDLLAPHTEQLATALDAHISVQGANDIEDAIGSVLLSAAATTLAHVDDSSLGYTDLEEQVLRHGSIEEQIGQLPAGTALDLALADLTADLSGSAQLRELSQARDVSVASAGTLIGRDSSAIDWVQVHPRSADPGGAAVVWSVYRNADGVTLVITVQAEHRRTGDRLFARVELADGGTLATVLGAEATGYSAVVALPDDWDRGSLRVGVYSAEFGSGARRGSADEVVRTVRKFVRDTVSARLADLRRMATGDLRDGDIAAFAAEKRAIRPD